MAVMIKPIIAYRNGTISKGDKRLKWYPSKSLPAIPWNITAINNHGRKNINEIKNKTIAATMDV